MEMIGQYALTTPLTNKNAGSCRWCFASRDGREFFIKEFLSPKFPDNDTISSPAKIEKRKRACADFEKQKTRIYRAVNAGSDGNAARIEELFRIGSRYYMAMERIQALDLRIQSIFCLPEERRIQICAIIAHAVAGLHKEGFVHSDIKHSNIMFVYSRNKNLTAKVIDYDSGFMEDDPPKHAEEIAGDQIYFSPEACKCNMGEMVQLTCKLDVFALGVLFHQYLAGDVPLYDKEKFSCVGEAVAMGEKAGVATGLPKNILTLLTAMLSEDPLNRPTALEVYSALRRGKAEDFDPEEDIPPKFEMRKAPEPECVPKEEALYEFEFRPEMAVQLEQEVEGETAREVFEGENTSVATGRDPFGRTDFFSLGDLD